MTFTGYLEFHIQGEELELPVQISYDWNEGIDVDCVELCGQPITDILTSIQDSAIEQQCIEDMERQADRAEALAEDAADSQMESRREALRDRGVYL